MRALAVSLAIIVLAGPAFAQSSGLTGAQHRHAGPAFGPPQETPKVKADEKAYRAAIGRMPDQKVSDPWQSVRAADSAKAQK
jgi:hypothetical protein